MSHLFFFPSFSFYFLSSSPALPPLSLFLFLSNISIVPPIKCASNLITTSRASTGGTCQARKFIATFESRGKKECYTANCITSLRVSPGGLQILPEKVSLMGGKKLHHARIHRPASKPRGKRIPEHPLYVFLNAVCIGFFRCRAVAYCVEKSLDGLSHFSDIWRLQCSR